MNERQLKSFIKAAETKSFSRAAAESYISTPAFVQQINLLENSIGFTLFHRNTHGVKLTEAGEVFYHAAVKILEIYQEACNKGLSLHHAKRSLLKIGCPPEQFPAFVTEGCEKFQKRYPNTSLEFISSSLRQHLQDLRLGKIDLCFMAEPNVSFLNGLCFHPLSNETFSFCMQRNHPLAEKEILEATDLLKYPILCGTYEFLKKPFTEFLPSGADIKMLPFEYDMSTQSRSMMSKEIIIIHSHWANYYSGNLKVIPSNIFAGLIGAISVSPVSVEVKNFLKFLPPM